MAALGVTDDDPAPASNSSESSLRAAALARARAGYSRDKEEARRRRRGEAESLAAEFDDEGDGFDDDEGSKEDVAANINGQRGGAGRNVEHCSRLRALASRWQADLYGSVMPFWLKHSIDRVHGGYFTCLDHDGSVYDETKYAWLQGRQVYLLSRLYNEASCGDGDQDWCSEEVRADWLRAAANGVDFLDRARDPETGHLFFSTTRDGSARLHLQRKPYSGVFYVQGMLEFWRALQVHKRRGSPVAEIVPYEARASEFLRKAHQTFKDLDSWIRDPSLCGRPVIPAFARDKGETRLADVMCMASLSLDFLKAGSDAIDESSGGGGKEYYLGLIQEAMKNCERHYDVRRGSPGIFLEQCSSDGLSSDSPAGRLFSPGHSIEVAWFLFMMCDAVGGSARHEKLALDVLEGSLSNGWDDGAGGGLFYMMDVEGKPMLDATVTADGKLWWPHSEALIALTMAFTRTGEEKWLLLLEKVHEYTYRTFVDRRAKQGENAAAVHMEKAGGWYGYCNRDGSLARTCVGGNYKGCFHVPRALLICTQLASCYCSGAGSGAGSGGS